MTDAKKIEDAWQEQASIKRMGLMPAVDQNVLTALIPPGGDWRCAAEKGAITRSVVWRGAEVCLVNARGDLDDQTEGEIAMGLRATPLMDKALRSIFALADDPDNLDLIKRIALAAIGYVEMPAPKFPKFTEEY